MNRHIIFKQFPPMPFMPHGRNNPRIPVTGTASLVSILTKEEDNGTVLDISRKGTRVVVTRKVQRDQKLTLTLHLHHSPPINVLLATVRWVHGSVVGVEFIDVEDQVFLDAVLPTKTPCRSRVF
jgi:hypothetical protein